MYTHLNLELDLGSIVKAEHELVALQPVNSGHVCELNLLAWQLELGVAKHYFKLKHHAVDTLPFLEKLFG